jgi:phage N-6-adenine-methyltransferase
MKNDDSETPLSLELERRRKIKVKDAARLKSLSESTFRRRYRHLIEQVSERRQASSGAFSTRSELFAPRCAGARPPFRTAKRAASRQRKHGPLNKEGFMNNAVDAPVQAVACLDRGRGGRSVKLFDPRKTSVKLAVLAEGAKAAARVKDWDALDKFIDEKVEEIRSFLAWWKAKVTPGHRPKTGRGGIEKLVAAAQLVRVVEATNDTGISKFQAARWHTSLDDEASFRADSRASFTTKVLPETEPVRGTAGTGNNEWFTPNKYLPLVREVLGEIDLDPASHTIAQRTVQAAQYFTKQDDGLKHEWHGRVWLNPPYDRLLIPLFVAKLLAEWKARRTTAAILLTHAYTSSSWFQNVAANASAICFPSERVRFYKLDGEPAKPTQGQAFAYFGDDVARFTKVFGALGAVGRFLFRELE